MWGNTYGHSNGRLYIIMNTYMYNVISHRLRTPNEGINLNCLGGSNVADKYALAVTKNLGLVCNSWSCSAQTVFLSCIRLPWLKEAFKLMKKCP